MVLCYEKDAFFMKKGHQKFLPLYSIPFASVLYQNEPLRNFCKRGPRLIVECNIGLQYALPNLDNLLF